MRLWPSRMMASARYDLLLGQLAAIEVIATLVATVAAFIDTMVTDIQRGKNDDALAVNGFLDFAGNVEQPLFVFWLGQFQKHGYFVMGQPSKRSRFFKDSVDLLLTGVSAS